MGRYAELDKDKNEILTQLYQSQNLVRLLTIQNDPLSPSIPNITDISNALKPLVKNAFIYPTSADVGCKLVILFRNIESRDKSKYIGDYLVDIHILVHEQWWDIKSETRAYKIADEIENILCGNTKLSMGGLKSIGGKGYYDFGNGNPFKAFNIIFQSTDMHYKSGI